MEYTFLRTETTTERIEAYSKLLSSVFYNTDKFSSDFLTWQYAQNPNGEVVGFDAFHGETLAGHYVTIPVSYYINGKIRKGLLSLNTATDSNHRGKGLFTQLANRTYEEAKKLGYEFVIGVANQNSTHGFLKKLGFYLISPLIVKTGIGSVSFDKSLNYLAYPNWTEKSLEWRLNNPEGNYFVKNRMIYSKTDKSGISAQLFKGLENDFKLNSNNPVLKLWIGLARDLRCKGLFFNLPKKLKPSPLNLIFKDLNGDLPKLNKEDILFELIDFDGY